ncbi:leucine-rich repeat receptor protein kinase EMS1 [Amaranthus tricolor]|uniref:leucine-rich repeat receptor protein kinase EMS1 n=1 Tax=Amaranthus tricolor TaxID=29722 RepID=UPI00258B8F3E|nr:leucine-rich repeat receptor protein kinase EMS1 [Amaranthus tricolor]
MNHLQTFLTVIGCFIFITLLCVLLLLLWNQCKRKSQSPSQIPVTISRPDPNSTSFSIFASFDPSLPQVSMPELLKATNGFDPKLIIGDGSSSLVYKAELSSGVTVAVKKLSLDAFQGLREFCAETETLGKLRHPNIIKILGYCVSGSDLLLIYEFIEKGSLDQWLLDTPPSFDSNWVPLSWNLRVKIIKGVANGLYFLHGLETHIVHRDIKASNVLLDADFDAHIADFGLARRIEGADSHISTQAAGTMGYMPPEYFGGYTAASVKGDVYSFGVLMFEVATGKRPNWPIKEDGQEIWMLEWAKKRIDENKEFDVLDNSISMNRNDLNQDEVCEYFRIANLCTCPQPRERPPMCDVVKMLDHLGNV